MKKIEIGDIFEIPTHIGMGYFQCVKEAPRTECETIRIFYGVYKNVEESNLNQLAKEKEVYFIQFPLKYAVKKNLVKYVGNYAIPEHLVVPRYYRTEHILRGEFICWHIVDSETLKRESVKELSELQRKL